MSGKPWTQTRDGGGTTKKEAQELEWAWRKEVEQPPAPAKKRAAFSGFARHFLDVDIIPNRKRSYQISTQRVLSVHLVPFFGDADLRSIDDPAAARIGAGGCGEEGMMRARR